jgi:hypothetical protein
MLLSWLVGVLLAVLAAWAGYMVGRAAGFTQAYQELQLMGGRPRGIQEQRQTVARPGGGKA